MRRFVFISIILSLSISGCSRKKKGLNFMVGGAPNEISYWEKLSKEFTSQTGIQINLVRQPTDTDQRRQGLIIPLKARKRDPDVFLMDVVWIGQFAASGWLEPLNKFISQDRFSLSKFFKKILSNADTYKGKLIALPVYIDGGLLYYRKDLLMKYGYTKPPETWKELVDYSLKIQEKERRKNPNFCGFVWQGAQYEGLVCTFLEFAKSNRGNFFPLNSRENIEALRFMYDLIHSYKISPPNTFTDMKEEEVRMFFQNGNALFERNWPYAWKIHQSEESKIRNKIGIASLPHFKNGESCCTLGGWHIGISKYSDMKNDGWKFVRFILSKEIQRELTLNLGWNPSRKDVYEDKIVTTNLPHLKVLKNIFKTTVARPNLPYYTSLSEIVQRYVNSALSGKLKPESALNYAQKEAKEMIKHYEQ
jgi:multiple sugar transport system substrate-binding protein